MTSKARSSTKGADDSKDSSHASKLKRKDYEAKLDELHMELVKMQYWIKATGKKLVLVFEGRDADGLEQVTAKLTDVILLDLRLPDQSGLEALTGLRQIDARIPVIFVTMVRSADSAIEATRHGAYDYLLKPIDLQKLDRVISEALKVSRLMREPAVVAETPPDEELPGEAIIGCCPGMQEAYKAIGRVADQTFPVLITGEIGTGKELVARALQTLGNPPLEKEES